MSRPKRRKAAPSAIALLSRQADRPVHGEVIAPAVCAYVHVPRPDGVSDAAYARTVEIVRRAAARWRDPTATVRSIPVLNDSELNKLRLRQLVAEVREMLDRPNSPLREPRA